MGFRPRLRTFRLTRAVVLAALLALVLGSTLTTPPPATSQTPDPRYFPETGYRIEDDAVWNYFLRRGGERTFGFPVSRPFTLRGARVHIFQRHVLQRHADGSVRPLNLFDAELFPFTRINGSMLPPVDPEYVRAAPPAADLQAVLAFMRQRVPEVWEGEPVGFLAAVLGSVRYEDAFPDGSGEAGLLPGFALEVWGLPTSAPTRDPSNHGFIYQRFQRGVLHYDRASARTSALLLADYFKAVITGVGLPADLEAQAQLSLYYRQYRPGSAKGLASAADVPDTDMSGAFPDVEPHLEASQLSSGAVAGEPTPSPGTSTCAGDERMTFAPAAPVEGNEILVAVTSATRHRYVRLTGPTNPSFVREREGQRGWVWEWTAPATYMGRHDFTFYVDSTVVCTANFVLVTGSPALVSATATPSLTHTPTATALLTPAPTSTSTPVATATATATSSPTPQVSDAALSIVSVAPPQQKADKLSSITLTVTVLDSGRSPIVGKLVRISSSRAADAIAGRDQFTNVFGQVSATISSCSATGETPPMTSTYTIQVVTDGVTLAERPSVTWNAGTACS